MKFIRSAISDLRNMLKWILAGVRRPDFQTMKSTKKFNLTRVGSEYGGWIIPSGLLQGKVNLLSCGVGEDISFDVEFARQLADSKIVFVDPTPRSMQYLDAFEDALKNKDEVFDFAASQQVLDISGLRADQFLRVNKAVWDKPGSMTFYAPKQTNHVSFSLANLQDTEEESAIEVEVDTIRGICQSLDIAPDIVKLDIEGVAASTVRKMLSDGIRPKIVLAELEELMKPSLSNKTELELLRDDLRKNGYELLSRDRVFNFTFVRALNPN